MVNPSRKIMISAGEASGDVYGARLVREARLIDPSLSFFGMGGPHMRAEGVDTLVDANDMAVVGLVEVVGHLPAIIKAYRMLRLALERERPDLVILIDYQDFNHILAAAAKKAGAKVLYYISPQIWAWRAGRVRKMAKIVDHMAVLFDFEVPYYESEQVPVTFVGHPLLDMVRATMTKAEAVAAFRLDSSRRTVGLFPGSRRSEIRNLLTTILDSAKILKSRFPDVQFILPLASSLSREDIDPQISASGLDVTIVEGKNYDVMQVCDVIISVSGTVTMEIALMGIPMVIIYRMSPLTYAVGKRVIKVAHIGISNIVAGERVVPELIQDDAQPEKIAFEAGRMLDDPVYHTSVREKLLAVRGKLGSGGCSRKVAQLAVQLAGGAR